MKKIDEFAWRALEILQSASPYIDANVAAGRAYELAEAMLDERMRLTTKAYQDSGYVSGLKPIEKTKRSHHQIRRIWGLS